MAGQALPEEKLYALGQQFLFSFKRWLLDLTFTLPGLIYGFDSLYNRGAIESFCSAIVGRTKC
jgi:hypothetical protein